MSLEDMMPKANSLGDPKKGPTGKQKVTAVRDVLLRERDRLLEQIEREAKNSITHLTGIKREAVYGRTAASKVSTLWGGYGPDQHNASGHIDALAAQAFAYDQCIQLLDRILGETTERSNDSGRKDEGEAQEGQAEAPREGKGGEGSAEREGGDDKPVVRKRNARPRAGGGGRPASATGRRKGRPAKGR